jgi:hypothetical protein
MLCQALPQKNWLMSHTQKHNQQPTQHIIIIIIDHIHHRRSREAMQTMRGHTKFNPSKAEANLCH